MSPLSLLYAHIFLIRIHLSLSLTLSDKEDGGDNSRKKLRLSKDQSTVLEESFKEHKLHQLFRVISKIQIDFEIQSDFEALSPPSSALARFIHKGNTLLISIRA
ncbi:unnamed protein product [Camellia sinensis]